ncbi:MAG: hypothetical protein Q7S52_00980 [bacterium]|nr:hypothetical protein [bacterium]
MHKSTLVAFALSAIFLAGCGDSSLSPYAPEASQLTPDHPKYIEYSGKLLLHRNGSVVPVIPLRLGDRGVTPWAIAKYLDAGSSAIAYCDLLDGTELTFVREDSVGHVLVSVTDDRGGSEYFCKGEVVVSLEEFVRYRYNYLQHTKEDLELQRLITSPK